MAADFCGEALRDMFPRTLSTLDFFEGHAFYFFEDLGDTFPRRSNTLDALRRSADKRKLRATI